MERAFLEGTDAQPVSDAATRALTRRGAIVDEHTPTHVVFEGLALDAHRFDRGGVLTLTQPALEKEVELRLRVRSRLTGSVFWWVVSVELAIALLTFVVGPRPSTWFAIGVALWAIFLVVGLVHLGTIPSSRAAERDLLREILEEARPVAARVLTDEDRQRAEAEEEVDAEVLERDLRSRSK